MFPYEQLDSSENLSHVGPVGYDNFYSNLTTTIKKDEHGQFLKMLKENDCITMDNWLLLCNVEGL